MIKIKGYFYSDYLTRILTLQYTMDAKYKYNAIKPGNGDWRGGQRVSKNKTGRGRKADIISMNSLNIETDRDTARFLLRGLVGW